MARQPEVRPEMTHPAEAREGYVTSAARSGAGEGNRTLVVSLGSSPPLHESDLFEYDYLRYFIQLTNRRWRAGTTSYVDFRSVSVPNLSQDLPHSCEVYSAARGAPTSADDAGVSGRRRRTGG
jgi:hypothetical protein